MSGDTGIGILSIGTALPAGRVTAAEIAEAAGLTEAEVRGLGVESRTSPGAEDQPIAMAAEAARRAFARVPGFDPAEVDVVLWTGEEYKDHVAQTASIRLQEEVGARAAWAFDLVGQGVTTIVGLRVARALMIGDPEVRTVLLAGGSRNVDLVDPRSPATRWMLATGAGAGAMLLRRGASRNRLATVVTADDPSMADEVFVPAGGTVEPFSHETIGSDRLFFAVPDAARVARYVSEELPARLAAVARDALREAGGGVPRPPSYAALRHLDPTSASKVLDALRVPPGATDGLADVGHTGPHDVVLSLERGLERGALSDGGTALLASAGIGFTYGAAVVEWGPM